MIIGGLQKFSLIDYPGKISSIIFTQGCNFACAYCHNKELIRTKEHNNVITPDEVLTFLKQRRKKIDAVVITGGEPTIQPDLIEYMQKIKKMGFLIKLDTNGSSPEVIRLALEMKLVDYIAMDIKAPLDKYENVIKTPVDTEKIATSMALIKNSGVRHEFRTTVLKFLLSEQDIKEILALTGDSPHYLQKYRPSKGLEQQLGRQENYNDAEFAEFRENFGSNCGIR